ATGSLPFDTSLRASLRGLTLNLIGDVTGLSGNYKRAGAVGLALDKSGTLQLDSAKFSAALAADPADVRALFSARGIPSSGLTYLSDTTRTRPGTFAVAVTHAATQASLPGAGFSGTYTDSGVADGITVTDGSTFNSGRITIVTG